MAAALSNPLSSRGAALIKPILYVTQTPVPDETLSQNHVIAQTKMSVASAMQNPLADTSAAPRGGALWIRYADGTRRNLTAAAGYGGPVDANGNASGFQGANSIAVQRPALHWNGTKAIFSMVVGAPATAGDTTLFRWQLYEITNFGQGQTPVITYVAGQQSAYNNTQACYDTQDRIIFVSDAPRGMQAHLYPQLDEYLSLPCNSGLWRLDRANGNELRHIIHTPSGAFSPFIDSAGRVLFVQWDHLSRDSSATYDRPANSALGETWTQTFNGTGTFDSENPGAGFALSTPQNYAAYNSYPEPRNFDKSALAGTNLNGNAFNQFFPWECHEDGAGHEVQNHVGRHELGGSLARPNFTDDPNLVQLSFPGIKAIALNFLHLAESAASAGTFFAVNPPEFGTHMAGPIVRYNGAAGINPDTMAVTYVTPPVNVPNPALGQAPLASPADVYRNPTPLSDGSVLAVHAAVTQYDSNVGADSSHPLSRFAFRLRTLISSGTTMAPDTVNNPTTPQNVSVSQYINGTLVTYTGAPLWELDPVEVLNRSASKPATLASGIASVEQTVFDEEGVHAPTFQNYLRTQNLALVVNRDSTRRDAADRQQPFNLKVSWSNTQTLGAAGKVYDIGWLQLLQADAIRGYTGNGQNIAAPVLPGRRTMPVALHDTLNEMPTIAGAPSGSVKLGNDGSWAAIVPAGRAVSWHLLDGTGTKSQVKERYWVSFAPGEVRTCAVCHGVNTADQAGNLGAPTNKPAALRTVLQYWKGNHPPGAAQHASASSVWRKNAGVATISVTRTNGSVGPVSVTYSTVNGTAFAGTDFTATSGTLTWADGDTAPKVFSVPLLNNTVIGPNKAFTVALSNPIYAALGGTPATTVTLQEPPLNAWLFGKFGTAANTPAIGALDADPDGDGATNLAEFAFNTEPLVAATSPLLQPTLTTDPLTQARAVTVTYHRRKPPRDITYHVEVSSDLSVWNESSAQELGASDDGNGLTDNVTVRAAAPAGTGRVFVRIRVTQP